MAKKSRRNKSSQTRFRRTLSKTCLSIASIPVLLANPASAIAAASITINATTRTSRVSLSSGLGLSISSTGFLTVPTNAVNFSSLGETAGNINNDGTIFSLDPDTATAIDLTSGTALGITNDATPGAYATIHGSSAYTSSYGYASGVHQGVGIGTKIQTTRMVGITNNSAGYIYGTSLSTVRTDDYGYYNNAYTYSLSSGAGTGISIASSPLTGGITNLGTIVGRGEMNSRAYSDAYDGNAYAYAYGQAVGRGLDVFYSTIDAGISNTGSIIGTARANGHASASSSSYYGYYYYAGAYADVNASGIGVAIVNGSDIAGITNNSGGVIEGYGYSFATAQASSYYGSSGDADAFAKGLGVSVDYSTISGNITNSGRITGEGLAGAYEGRSGGSANGQGIGIGLTDSTVTGNIVNSGLIEGIGNQGYGYGNNNFGVGVNIDNSSVGNITNNSRAEITGRSESVYAYYIYGNTYGTGLAITGKSSSVGNVTNNGDISGSGMYGSIGVKVDAGSITGTLSNYHGYISARGIATSYGYKGASTGLDVTNGGSIASITNQYGLISGWYGDRSTGIRVADRATVGSITNSDGLIAGKYGNNNIGIDAKYGSITSITNNAYGQIVGYGGYSSTGIASRFDGTISNITNNVGGSIAGYSSYSGRYSSGIQAKTIGGYGDGTGIKASLGGKITSITNSGDISGHGKYLAAGISADRGGTIGTITNNAEGVIYATTSDVFRGGPYSGVPAGIRAFGGQITGTITNRGEITGFSGILAQGYGGGVRTTKVAPGFAGYAGTISGNIVNEDGGVIYGLLGVGAFYGGTITGTITNNGKIDGKYGIASIKYGNISGAITNNSNIYAGAAGIYAWQRGSIGSITNNGNIIGDGAYGIVASDYSSIGAITNNATGTIYNSGTGVHVDSTSSIESITNKEGGLISGDSFGIYAAGAVTGGIVNAGTVYGGYSAIVFGTSYQNAVTNTGLIDGEVELGIGTLNLDGVDGSVTGAVSGTPGSTVNVNGLFTSENTFNVDSFNIANGGTFNMANTVTTASGVSNDGVLAVAAGSSATIEGDYTQTANGVFRTGATSSSEYGQLAVTGAADLTASNKVDVNVTPDDTLANGDVLSSVLSAGTLNAGALTVTDDSAIWDFIGTVNGNAIDLTVDQGMTFVEAIEGTPQEPKAKGAAVVFDEVSDGGNIAEDMQKVLDALGALESQSDVARAIASTLPGFTGTYARMTQKMMSANGNRVVKSRLQRMRGISSGDETFKDTEIWGDVFATQAEQDRVDNIDGYEADSYGLSIGVDTEVSPQWKLGAAFTYGQSEIDGDGTINAESLDIETFQGTVYAIGEITENTELTLSAAYGHNENDAVRHIDFEGINRTAKANFNSWHTYLDAEVARSYQVNEKTRITPSLKAQYTYASVEDFTETGAGALNLHVEGDSADSLVATFDARVDHDVTAQVNLNAHAGIGYDFLTDRSSITSSFEGGGSTFITEGFDPDPVVVSGGVGIEMESESGVTLSVNYDVEAREDYDNQTAWLKLRVPLK